MARELAASAALLRQQSLHLMGARAHRISLLAPPLHVCALMVQLYAQNAVPSTILVFLSADQMVAERHDEHAAWSQQLVQCMFMSLRTARTHVYTIPGEYISRIYHRRKYADQVRSSRSEMKTLRRSKEMFFKSSPRVLKSATHERENSTARLLISIPTDIPFLETNKKDGETTHETHRTNEVGSQRGKMAASSE